MIAVYSIKNMATGQSYIGSTKNFKNRIRSHLGLLKNNKHHCRWLQSSWNKYGEHSFSIFPCFNYVNYEEALSIEDQIIKEFYGISIFNSKSSAIGVNGCKNPKSQIQKQKMSAAAFSTWENEKIREKRQKSMKGERSIVVCPHCKQLGGGGNMYRYHFENCKHK